MNHIYRFTLVILFGISHLQVLPCESYCSHCYPYLTGFEQRLSKQKSYQLKTILGKVIKSEGFNKNIDVYIKAIVKNYKELIQELSKVDKEFVKKSLTIIAKHDLQELQAQIHENESSGIRSSLVFYFFRILVDISSISISKAQEEKIFSSTSLNNITINLRIATLALMKDFLLKVSDQISTSDRELLDIDHSIQAIKSLISKANNRSTSDLNSNENITALNDEIDNTFEKLYDYETLNADLTPLLEKIVFPVFASITLIAHEYVQAT